MVPVRINDLAGANGIADHFADVDHIIDRLGGAFFLILKFRDSDFTADHHDVAFHERFASNAAGWINLEAGIKDGIGNGVRNFIWMAFANRL